MDHPTTPTCGRDGSEITVSRGTSAWPAVSPVRGTRVSRRTHGGKRERRHTSTVTVAVLDAGPGGQHRIATDTAVVARHLPSGLSARVDGRSQTRRGAPRAGRRRPVRGGGHATPSAARRRTTRRATPRAIPSRASRSGRHGGNQSHRRPVRSWGRRLRRSGCHPCAPLPRPREGLALNTNLGLCVVPDHPWRVAAGIDVGPPPTDPAGNVSPRGTGTCRRLPSVSCSRWWCRTGCRHGRSRRAAS